MNIWTAKVRFPETSPAPILPSCHPAILPSCLSCHQLRSCTWLLIGFVHIADHGPAHSHEGLDANRPGGGKIQPPELNVLNWAATASSESIPLYNLQINTVVNDYSNLIDFIDFIDLSVIYLSNFLKETHDEWKARKDWKRVCTILTKQPVSARNHYHQQSFAFLKTASGSKTIKEQAKLQNSVNKRILKKGSFTTAHNARIRAGPIMRKSITGFRPNRSETRPKLGLRKNSTTLPRE